MKVLLVEDQRRIAGNIQKGLERKRMIVDLAFTGPDGYDLAMAEAYDVLVVDIMLPGFDGITLIQKLRESKENTPILLLTAKGETEDKVLGLNAGADDYLSKPFAFEELVARIRALSRRPRTVESTVLEVADLTIDITQMVVQRAHVSIDLSPKEFALLEFLVRNKGRVFSSDELAEYVWDFESEVLPNTAQVYIGYLRKKIDRKFSSKPPLIKTVRGFGYKVESSH